jgi:hypothetical protein
VPLSEDQRAMLQLLLERGQSYDDIAGLLGLGVADVRARAREALTEMGGQDPDRDVGLTDYLLGQADPIGRADAARHLQSNPDSLALAEKLESQLRVLAPGADLPSLPEAKAPRRTRSAEPAAQAAAAGAPADAAGGGGRSELSAGQRQLIAGLLGAGLIVILIVLIVAGAFSSGGGGGNSSADTGGSGGATGTTGAQNAATQQLTRAVLQPVNGGNASGAAIFGRVRSGKNDVAVVQLAMSNLTPTKSGQIYVIWLHGANGQAFPLTRDRVDKTGKLSGLVPLQPQLLQALASGAFDSVAVSLASQQQVLSELKTTGKQRKLPNIVGQTVLDGKITGPGFRAARAAAQAQGATGAGGSSGG